MAVTIRGSTAATATNSPTSPAGTLIGDCVLVFHWTRGGAGVPTHTLQSGNGFVEIRSHSHNDGSTDGRLSLAYKIATADGANTYNAYTSDTGTDFAGIVVLQKNTFHPTLIGDVSNSVTQTTNALIDPGSIVTPQAQCLVLVCGAWYLSSAATVTVTQPTGYAEVWEMAGSNTAEMSVASKTVATATTEDPGTFNDDVAPSGTASITVAFRPMNYALTAAQATFTLTGNAAVLARGRTMAADTVGFTLTGNAAGLYRGYPITAATGAFTFTGNAAGTLRGYPLTAATGSFVLTGNNAILTYTPSGYTMVADTVAFALTGINAGLLQGYAVAAETGSYGLSGLATGLLWAHQLGAATGSFVLSGINAGLSKGYPLTAATGAFTLTGNSANLLQGYKVTSETGAFTLTGNATNFALAHLISAATGSFALTGNDVLLGKGFGFAASTGSFALTGNATNLLWQHLLSGAVGTFTLTGNAALFQKGRTLIVDPASFVLTGNSSGLLFGRKLGTASGAFTWSGNNAGLLYSYLQTLQAGSTAIVVVVPMPRLTIEEPIPTLKEDLLPVVDELRKIAHDLGFRPYTVSVVRSQFSGLESIFAGVAPTDTTVTLLTNAGGNPRVRWLDETDYARGVPTDAELEVGPLTPPYPTGGTSYDTLEQLAAPAGSDIYYLVDGPGLSGGVRFEKVAFDGNRALGYRMLLKRASDNP